MFGQMGPGDGIFSGKDEIGNTVEPHAVGIGQVMLILRLLSLAVP